jgi:mono/diheme cytochrome c family protein
MRRSVVLLAWLASLAASACDNRQAIQKPDWTLARMLSQRRADPYETTAAFADGQVMRSPPRGAVSTDDDRDAPAPPITKDSLALGRARFDGICATCHGVTGDGDSVVASKMTLRRPPSLMDARYRALSREQLFVIVSEGYGLMPSYADMLPRDERWATVAYVQALQISQHALVAELPDAVRSALVKEAR